MQFVPYLSFDRQCEQAFRFYHEVFGGELTHLMRNRETPYAAHFPEEYQDGIMHARLMAPGAVLMGGDMPPGTTARPTGFAVNVWVDDAADGERIFARLADGGRVDMPIAETFWAERFGMVTDRFGIPWMVNVGDKPV